MIRYVGRPATGAGGVEPIPPPADTIALFGAILEWGLPSPTAYPDYNALVSQVNAGVVDPASA